MLKFVSWLNVVLFIAILFGSTAVLELKIEEYERTVQTLINSFDVFMDVRQALLYKELRKTESPDEALQQVMAGYANTAKSKGYFKNLDSERTGIQDAIKKYFDYFRGRGVNSGDVPGYFKIAALKANLEKLPVFNGSVVSQRVSEGTGRSSTLRFAGDAASTSSGLGVGGNPKMGQSTNSIYRGSRRRSNSNS